MANAVCETKQTQQNMKVNNQRADVCHEWKIHANDLAKETGFGATRPSLAYLITCESWPLRTHGSRVCR
jgi:hypothetical protein